MISKIIRNSKQSTLGSMASASSDTRSVIRTTAASFGYIFKEELEIERPLLIITNHAFVLYDVSRRITSTIIEFRCYFLYAVLPDPFFLPIFE